MFELPQPLKRTKLRQLAGREYHIFKRRQAWKNPDIRWAEVNAQVLLPHQVFRHRSMILRPLAGVNMQLQENKRTNLRLAVGHLNGVVLRPGETFSFWKLVGRPTAAKGYLEGLVLKQGAISSGVGGGLCQLGNLLFWLVAHSPLEVTERHRHGFDVFPDVARKVPFGAGATLAYNHVDLQFTNPTPHAFQLQLWLDDTHLNGQLLSAQPLKATYTVEERGHHMKRQHWGGCSRHNQIVQICTLPDGQTSERLLVENHALMMYEPFLD